MPKHPIRRSPDAFTQPVYLEADAQQWLPPMDVYETASEYVVRLEVAGVRKQDLRVGFSDNTLTVCGVRGGDAPETNLSYLRMEIEVGEFRREVHFPDRVDRSRVSAFYREGLLKVVLPKHEC